jgi:hypothetical protein
MNDDREERIRARAHEIWENAGRPEGLDKEHWEQASREIDEEDAQAGGANAGWSGDARAPSDEESTDTPASGLPERSEDAAA